VIGPTKPRILALLGSENIGGCEIYRVTLPLTQLGQHGWTAEWMPLDDAAALGNQGGLARLLAYDIYILPRLVPLEWDYGIDAWRQLVQMQGKLVVYETDDDYTNEHRTVHGGGEDAIELARKCDSVTVSTPYLRQLMLENGCKDVHMLPNCVDMHFWETTATMRVDVDYLTIGLTGSETHKDDWRVLASVMPHILADYPTVRFLLGGYHPPYFEGLPDERVLRQEGVPYSHYPLVVAAADIVLCPVDPQDCIHIGVRVAEAGMVGPGEKHPPLHAFLLEQALQHQRLLLVLSRELDNIPGRKAHAPPESTNWPRETEQILRRSENRLTTKSRVS